MIDKKFVELLFNGASIERWNDLLRPIDLIELDKQAHKMIIAYIIANIEQKERRKKINWRILIEGSIFEYFRNIALTDIKRPVISYLYKRKKEEINQYVINTFEKYLKHFNKDFFERFKKYYFSDNEYIIERQILRASSTLATLYEFEIISEFNKKIHPVEKIYNDLINEVENYLHFKGVERILNKQKPYEFINFCGQLRFQKRWAQTPRVPKTSVLGHIYLVAVFVHLFSIKLNICDKGVYNTFFNALFHDLPEALTRDIISPIKMGIKGLDEAIKDYELKEIEGRLLPTLTPYIREEIRLYIIDEFENKIFIDGEYNKFETSEIIKEKDFLNKYNNDRFNPIFGGIVRIADRYAAFLEALYSKKHGISSSYISDAIKNYENMYKDKKLGKIDLNQLFSE